MNGWKKKTWIQFPANGEVIVPGNRRVIEDSHDTGPQSKETR